MGWPKYIGIIVSPVLENYCAEVASKCQQTMMKIGVCKVFGSWMVTDPLCLLPTAVCCVFVCAPLNYLPLFCAFP